MRKHRLCISNLRKLFSPILCVMKNSKLGLKFFMNGFLVAGEVDCWKTTRERFTHLMSTTGGFIYSQYVSYDMLYLVELDGQVHFLFFYTVSICLFKTIKQRISTSPQIRLNNGRKRLHNSISASVGITLPPQQVILIL